jgi:hypothetical protein
VTYANARSMQIGQQPRPSAYAVRELGGVTTVDAHARRGHYELFGSPAVSVRRNMLRERLVSLNRQWRADTGYLSSMEAMKEHPAYKTIVAMDDEAIPFILESLAAQPDLLVMALHDITGEDPVAPEHHGRIQAIVQDWLRWGTERGHSL